MVIQAARRVLAEALDNGSPAIDVCGVVLKVTTAKPQGRVVQSLPLLLPDEQFIPIELIRARRSRSGASRLRFARLSSAPDNGMNSC